MIMKRKSQTVGQSDAELALNDMIGQQHRGEGLGIETEQGEAGECPDIEAVAAVGQQGGFTEVTSRTNVTDQELFAPGRIHCQFRFTLGNDVKMAIIFTLPIHELTLFKRLRVADSNNPAHLFTVNILEKNRPEQALYECFLLHHGKITFYRLVLNKKGLNKKGQIEINPSLFATLKAVPFFSILGVCR